VSRYLIDTNVLSEPLRPQPNPALIKTFQLHTDKIAIASVTWHEIWYGCLRLPPSRKREQIEHYLQEVQSTFPILPYGTAEAEWHAAERARLTGVGQPPAYADGQIAAISHTNHLILVTNNVSDFAGFQNLAIENWFSS
jgi:tRNA(fMet)-specific endonuclease VapC